MTQDHDTFRAQVAAALAPTINDVGPGGPEEHPTPDELTAYHQGRLDGPDAERIEEHLVRCRRCFEEVTELDGFVQAGHDGPGEVRDLQEAAAWRALRPRLPGPSRRLGPVLALAASLLVAAVGLGFWGFHQHGETVRLRQELARLSQPQPAAILVDLFPDAQVRGAGGEPATVDLAAVDHLTLILHLPEPPGAGAYEAEIVGAEERALWSGPVRMDEYGTLTLGIPRSFLEPGSYRIDLYAAGAGGRQPLDSFPLELVASGE